MSATPCDFYAAELTVDDGFLRLKDCIRYVEKKAFKTAAVGIVNTIVSKIAEKAATTVSNVYVLETPRRIEFSSRLTGHRYAPLPIAGISAPFSADGYDFPIRYDTVPAVSVDMRKIMSDYTDTMKQYIEEAKKRKIIVLLTTGSQDIWDLMSSRPVAFTEQLLYDNLLFSHDKDYPPSDPLEVYVEGELYELGNVQDYGYVIDYVDANVIAYKTQAGDYYSGYGGFYMRIEDSNNVVCAVRFMGRTFDMKDKSAMTIIWSGVFSIIGYYTTTPKTGCP